MTWCEITGQSSGVLDFHYIQKFNPLLHIFSVVVEQLNTVKNVCYMHSISDYVKHFSSSGIHANSMVLLNAHRDPCTYFKVQF